MKVHRHFFNRGSKSRNKVAVGEPAAGSFSDIQKKTPKILGPRLLAFYEGEEIIRARPPNKLGFAFCSRVNIASSRLSPSTERENGVEHGFHNVSRWMTWLPISLKNAAKCDKWYQLQNHSITESLNAKGAREKFLADHPRACRSQCRSKTKEPTYFHEVFPRVHALWWIRVVLKTNKNNENCD